MTEDLSAAGSYTALRKGKEPFWNGVSDREYQRLFNKFRWLWTDERIESARKKGSLAKACDKKIKYLKSLLEAI